MTSKLDTLQAALSGVPLVCFPTIFKNLKHIVTRLCNHFNLIKAHTTGRPLKIKTEDALTLALYQHRSTRATKKSVYEDFKELLKCS